MASVTLTQRLLGTRWIALGCSWQGMSPSRILLAYGCDREVGEGTGELLVLLNKGALGFPKPCPRPARSGGRGTHLYDLSEHKRFFNKLTVSAMAYFSFVFPCATRLVPDSCRVSGQRQRSGMPFVGLCWCKSV